MEAKGEVPVRKRVIRFLYSDKSGKEALRRERLGIANYWGCGCLRPQHIPIWKDGNMPNRAIMRSRNRDAFL